MQPHIFYDYFSPVECDSIVEMTLAHSKGEPSGVVTSRAGVRSARSFLAPPVDSDWVSKKLLSAVEKLNSQYKFELNGSLEPPHCVRYQNGDFFKWHRDLLDQSIDRKISISVQLSDGTDYVGGNLEFSGLHEAQLARRKGNLIAFPSFLSHQVTPISSGTRYALITWALGPAFK